MTVLFFSISERLSRGDDNREEKIIPGSALGASLETVVMEGRVDGEELVGGLLDMVGDDDCRMDL